MAPNGKAYRPLGLPSIAKSARLYACVEGFANSCVTPSEGLARVLSALMKFLRGLVRAVSLESLGS
jgi:hypothetical protein